MSLIKKYCPLFLLLILSGILWGCNDSGDTESIDKYQLYYVNTEGTKLVTVNYESKSNEKTELVSELIAYMNLERKGYITALPSGVDISYYNIYDDKVVLNYTSSYLDMDSISELFVRAAIVLTLTQIEGIDYVEINIEGQPLGKSNGEVVGLMKSSDFIDKVGKTINNYENITINLYYANRTGNKLVKRSYSGIYDSSEPLEKFVVEKLIEGPTQEGAYRSLPKYVQLLGISTKDGICYVNFDISINNTVYSVKDEVMIYSIVNSLLEIPYINQVQISINGESNIELHDNISLSNTFTRNLDLVAE